MLPLVSTSWFTGMLQSLRGSIATNADLIAAVVAAVAAIVIMAKMVRFNYSLSSDDSGGGFGDIKAWEFIKPVLLLLCIELSPMMAEGVNEFVSAVMNDLSGECGAQTVKSVSIARKSIAIMNIEEKIESATMTLDEANKEILDEMKHQVGNTYDGKGAVVYDEEYDMFVYQTIDSPENRADFYNKIHASSRLYYEGLLSKSTAELQELAEAPLSDFSEGDYLDGSLDSFEDILKGDRTEFTWDNPFVIFEILMEWLWGLLVDIILWAYKMIILMRLYMGSMGQSIMLMFFPVIFLAMFFDRYRGAFGNFLTVYVELALWQPMASVLINISCNILVGVLTSGSGAFIHGTMTVIILVCSITAALNLGEYAKFAMTAFNGRGGTVGDSGLLGLRKLFKL